jgi:hypothetical protein
VKAQDQEGIQWARKYPVAKLGNNVRADYRSGGDWLRSGTSNKGVLTLLSKLLKKVKA